jgi:hypothetical protein
MTKTVKTYVELADLTGVHLECVHCHSSLTIPFQRLDRGVPAKCPNCNEDWGDHRNFTGRGDEPIPQGDLREVGTLLKRIQQTSITGVKISFEVSGLASNEQA